MLAQQHQQETPRFNIEKSGLHLVAPTSLVDTDIQVPRCPCGKSPLRCPKPDNCEMEDL